jgi:hypothetical protein
VWFVAVLFWCLECGVCYLLAQLYSTCYQFRPEAVSDFASSLVIVVIRVYYQLCQFFGGCIEVHLFCDITGKCIIAFVFLPSSYSAGLFVKQVGGS